MTQQLWAADPHQYGPGKIHILDDKEDGRTLCGKFTSTMPGKPTSASRANCKICLNGVESRAERERWASEAEKRTAEAQAQRERENAEWNTWYQSYLRSPAWAMRRRLVMERAKGICEGCLVDQATEVHHLTYAHAGDEFLWELRAICRRCHERWHEAKVA